MLLRGIILVFSMLVSLVFYQNCDPELNQDGPTETPGTVSKPMPGSVDKQQPINIAPNISNDGLQINLSTGEVVNEHSLKGDCLAPDILDDINQLLDASQICQDEPKFPEGEDVYCTMDLRFPWLEVHTTDSDTVVGLGRGNECPRSPIYLCENNDALKALIQNISDQDFGICP